jgi:hypothetical protein
MFGEHHQKKLTQHFLYDSPFSAFNAQYLSIILLHLSIGLIKTMTAENTDILIHCRNYDTSD